MPSEYLNATIIDEVIGEDVRLALTDGDFEVNTRLIRMASAMSDAALSASGHAAPLGLTANLVPELVQLATLGGWAIQAYGRKGLEVPPQFATYINILEGIREGKIPIPQLEPDPSGAVGGSLASDPYEGPEGKPVVFGGLRGVF